jgi:hypothetical protein
MKNQKANLLLSNKRPSFWQQQNFNKNYGVQARFAAMQNIQRASGKKGK